MDDEERQTTIRLLDQALSALGKQSEALHILAAHYPDAHHVLSSPRKPDAMIILEHLRHWLADPEQR
jgi:hypothetical protein